MRQSKTLITSIILFLSQLNLAAEVEPVPENENSTIGYGDAFTFGLVEGVTEFLPISSTGHLILVEEWVQGPDTKGSYKKAINAYLIVIQFGAILAVCILYFRQITSIILGFLGRDSKGKKLGLNLLAAFLPAAALGPFLDKWIEAILFGAVPVGFALILGAGLMQWAERRKRMEEKVCTNEGLNLDSLTIRNAFIVGILQCVAMWPGTSRSMMTIVGGYLVGLSRRQAAEFSFLLGLVTLSAAAGYKTITQGNTLLENFKLGPMVFGCVIAGIFAALSVRWLVGYLSRHGLGIFVWYRLILGLLVLVYFGIKGT